MLTATTTKPRDFSDLAREHQAAVDDAALLSFARSLGVSAESLKHLGIGRHRDTWVFPERDADGRIIFQYDVNADGNCTFDADQLFP